MRKYEYNFYSEKSQAPLTYVRVRGMYYHYHVIYLQCDA